MVTKLLQWWPNHLTMIGMQEDFDRGLTAMEEALTKGCTKALTRVCPKVQARACRKAPIEARIEVVTKVVVEAIVSHLGGAQHAKGPLSCFFRGGGG